MYPKRMKCIVGQSDYGLVEGKVYTILEEVVGFFEDRPHCVVAKEDGRTLCCHLSRFQDISETTTEVNCES